MDESVDLVRVATGDRGFTMTTGVTLEGQDGIGKAIEAKIKAAMGSIDGTEIAIVAGGSRGGETNAMIAKVQAGHMRDPFYLDQQAREAVRFAANGLTAAQYSTKKRAVDIMGELMLNAIGRNVEKQRNPDGGKFKGLTPNYANYKRRKFGWVVPILKATNDLLGGLRVRVSKLR